MLRKVIKLRSEMLFVKSKPIRLPWLISPLIKDTLQRSLTRLDLSHLVGHLLFWPKKLMIFLLSSHINSALLQLHNQLSHSKHHNSHHNPNSRLQSQQLLQNRTRHMVCLSNHFILYRLPAVSPTMTEGKIL